jgi:hypothetical protein
MSVRRALGGTLVQSVVYVATVGVFFSMASWAWAQGMGGSGMGGPGTGAGMGGPSGGRRGGGDAGSKPSDYYRGGTPPPSHTTLTVHGGQYLKTESSYYEIVIMPLQTRIYVYDQTLKPLSARDLHVQMSFIPPGERSACHLPFQGVALSPNMSDQDYVVVAWDARTLGSKETPVTIEFTGLPDRAHPTASFTPVFTSDNIRPYVAQVMLMRSEADRVYQQRICPACGGPLGGKGPVVKVLIGEYPLYLCSQDCMGAVQQTPQRFLPPQPPAGGR